MTWQELEKRIRDIASSRWGCTACTETIAGVKCDCVLKPDMDQWVLVEITQEHAIDKVRADVSKLSTVKHSLMAQDVFCRCFIVMEKTPTDSMRAAGEGARIKVLSAIEFQNDFFNYSNYVHIRKQKYFGSLINSDTGEPESNTYIDVCYQNVRTGEDMSITDINDLLLRKKTIILKGDFGLGKSRCIKQLFDMLTSDPFSNPYTIAINLRDHWGAKRAPEILDRHFAELGIDYKEFIKHYEASNVIYLLDGFDEMGTQSWSTDTKKMHHMRELSVCAIKDLLSRTQGGVLIAGREYYFNSDDEMLSCFGLTEKNAIILDCHHEFTTTELAAFVKENLPEKIEFDHLPIWIPKRPLVIQLLLKYAKDMFEKDYALEDICGFWYAFLRQMCEREAKIYPALNNEIIQNVLIYLANKTRNSSNNTGPISQKDLSDAFVAATGVNPTDESTIMLQRLPSIGRINADIPDRQFLDLFILNGLRAESIIQLSKSWDFNAFKEDWKNPLDQVGLSILSEYIAKEEKRLDQFISLARRAAASLNKILASDIVAAICLLNITSLDFQGLEISDAHFSYLTFEGKIINNLIIRESIIEKIDITNASIQESTTISKCYISKMFGISSNKGLPEGFQDCEIDEFEPLATTTLIKRANLSESQKLFVQMLRKIFWQPGAGRKESALIRGMGSGVNKALGEKMLSLLVDERLVYTVKGDEGPIYKPNRGEMGRIDQMITDLTLSEDPLWIKISSLS